ncbi:MAG: hypothetical protein M0C28_02125 [Candidatus Moduliflexus flocculans]|nr:hypothetical protein [Candidatus Moduliflexus flocculans]
MLFESLGFLPEGDELELYEGKRPPLRVKDLKDCAGTLVELVVRVVDARQRVTYGMMRSGNGHGYGGGGTAVVRGGGDRAGAAGTAGDGAKYFYMFEDETGLLEGVGETRCAAYGTPPVCFLRGEVRRDGEGVPKITKCAFLRSF